jgi:hypothetical protein
MLASCTQLDPPSRAVTGRPSAGGRTARELPRLPRRGTLRAIVGLVSAAAMHDLADEILAAVQTAVPRPSRPPRIAVSPTTVFRFDAETFELGSSSVDAGGSMSRLILVSAAASQP